MITEKDLLEKKKEIDRAKAKVSELKGEAKGLLKQLKEIYECDNLPEAKTKLKELENDIAKQANIIQEKSKKLEKYFEHGT